MKKINVRSPFFITVQKETAKVDPDDDCIRDADGFCIDDDPCITTPTLPQCPEEAVDSVFQDRNLICGATAVNIPVSGAVVYNFDIETTGRVNGDYTVSLNDLQIPVRIRMDVLANVPKTDLATGTAFENVGLTAYSDTFTQAGYATSGLSGTADADGNLDVTKTFAYNSSSHTGNLRFQIHVPVLTNNDMSISVSCPAKATVSTDPVTVGEVTIISFSSLNPVLNKFNNTSFRPSVKLNGVELGDGEAVFVKQNVIADELVFQAAQGTIMGVGRSNQSEQFINTRRFIQAATNSGAAGTGLTTLTPLLIGTGSGAPPSHTNSGFMGKIPNGNAADFSVRTFSAASRNTLVTYSGVNFIPDGINTIEVLLPTNLASDPVDPTNLERLIFQISISKHTIKNFPSHSPAGDYLTVPLSVNSGTSGGAAEAMVFRGTMYGHSSKLTLDFEGNNNTALNFVKKNRRHRFEIENPEVEELIGSGYLIDTTKLTPFESILDRNPVSLQVNLPNSPNITIPL